MSEVSIVTNDEIMEMTQLVFDRYYTELKRQLRRGQIPEEDVEQYCTEILAKVYQALQTQGVAATSYELDACAIPIINDELRKILVPLHLNGYRNLRENPITESQVEPQEEKEETVQQDVEEVFSALQKVEVEEIKNEQPVQVVSNGTVQVCTEKDENELNPELRMEVRRILQQEFQLEPTQVKPIVVVVNVAAPQAAVQATAEVVETESADKEVASTVEDADTEKKSAELVEEMQGYELSEQELIEILDEEDVEEEGVEVLTAQQEIAVTAEESSAEQQETTATEEEVLPVLQFDLEKMAAEAVPQKEKKSKHLWLWFPIIILLLVLLWLTAGMLMNYDIIPDINLGYEWFNETLFELF